ncbi:MAG: tetratricopeptide repeat protein [Scytonema hyalinum WJT4-NPBG1]|jgi:tetratricopeptide (TPR) repeat protein|nr:tetratricopeptide repeat protein [Scytonema hyalinum WJT4-NPBG1]
MSLNNRKRSITEGNRALELFTNREGLVRIFATYINDDPSPEKILFFHGDGGNGKSLLLKFLLTKCCKRFRSDIWQEELKPKTDVEVAEYITQKADDWDFIKVPAVLHDFGLRLPGEEQPQDPFYGLLMLRRNISSKAQELGYSLRFPLFDFACVWYLKQKGKLSAEKLKELFPQEEIDFLVEIGNALSDTSWGAIGKAVLGLFSKHLGEKFLLFLQQRGLKQEDVQAIQEMDVDRELIFELPQLLAQDLNAAMSQPNAPERIVLVFDTHEAFWGVEERGVLQGERYFAEDEWLRHFLTELELSSGIVTVVAGRELPKWDKSHKFPIPQDCLDAHSVYHLSPTDANKYLQLAGIEDATQRQNIINYSLDASGQVHPFLLGLCADVVLLSAPSQVLPTFDLTTSFEEKASQLINRLLSYVDRKIAYAVHALSACRAFNFSIYEYLGQKLRFDTVKPAFDILTEFSFVWEAQQRGQNWYRIHDLVRRLDYESNQEEIKTIHQQAHTELETYYRQLGEVPEAIYHANRLDWQRGVNKWVEKFEEALKQSRYEQCRSLLEVRNELIIQSNLQLGRVSRAEGDYFVTLSQYQEAEQEYLEAIAAYELQLRLTPDDTVTHLNKGNALQSLASLQSRLSQHTQALSTYEQAIASYDTALTLAPNHVYAHNNKGIALENLASLQSRLSQHTQALTTYEQAIASHDTALTLAPNHVYTHNNKGNALGSLASLQSRLSQHTQALTTYEQAIASYDTALTLAPNHVYTHNNKGNALGSLASLQSRLSQHTQALTTYEQAIASYDTALTLAPNQVYTHNNKGNALGSLASLQSRLSQHTQALTTYEQAIASHDTALTLAPNYVYTHNNKGNALQNLASLQSSLSQHTQALTTYEQAIASYDTALTLAPNQVYTHNNKGNALKNLASLQSRLSQHTQALTTYEQAIASHDTALTLAPNYVNAHNNKGLALRNLSNLLKDLSHDDQALQCYQTALVSFNRSLDIAPNDDNIRDLKEQMQELLSS